MQEMERGKVENKGDKMNREKDENGKRKRTEMRDEKIRKKCDSDVSKKTNTGYRHH